MLKFIVKRLLWMIPVMLGVLLVVFTINHFTPGDPVLALIGTNKYTQEQYDAKKAELGLDKPFFVQFFDYVKGVVTRFDLGTSYSSKRSVNEEMGSRIPVTLRLGLLGVALAMAVGIPLGIICATHHQKPIDFILTGFAIVLAAVPDFCFALVGMIIFAYKLKLVPASGLDNWKSYILPVVCLSLQSMAYLVRMTRSSMLEVVRQDYIRTARAKGLNERKVIYKHALRNALIPVITAVGMDLTTIMGGSVLVETIFSIPGIGSWMARAVSSKNYPVVLSGVLMISMVVCVMNLLVDLAYAFADPRIKAQFMGSGKKKKKNKPAVKAAVPEE